MTLDDYIKLRPFAYHTTAKENLPQIREGMRIDCAATLLRKAGRASEVHERRKVSRRLHGPGITAHVRDQQPLHEGNIAFEEGWDLDRLVELLNSFVFFWPGNADEPIPKGARHFGASQGKALPREELVVIRVATQDLLAVNPEPLFCQFNSGAPRTTGGRLSPRGESTFLPVECFAQMSDIKEMVFREAARPRGRGTGCDESRRLASYRRAVDLWPERLPRRDQNASR